MTLKTSPIYFYGFEVTAECPWIDFKEGELGVERSIKVDVGSYCLEELRLAIENAFNAAGDLLYTVTADRFTRKFTIITNNLFELLVETGSHADSSLLKCVGFRSYPVWGEGGHLYGDPHLFYGDVDSGQKGVHAAKFSAGFCFDPQFCMQDFGDADNGEKLRLASVNESVDGEEVEVLYFGEDHLYDFNFKYITEKQMPCGSPIRNDANALANVNSFLKWAIRKKVIEYIPNKEDPNVYEKIRLEKSKSGRSGLSYKLKELFKIGLPEFYETGVMTFRRLTK